MKRRWPAIVVVSAAVATGVAGGGAAFAISGAVLAAGSWGRAIEVPGLAALNTGGNAAVESVSCTSPGDCAADGIYRNRRRHYQGFVVSERRGRWGTAIKVPGLAALNTGGNASLGSMSCTSPGNCADGGDYRDQLRHYQGFVVSERNGRWGTAIKVPGLAALNVGGTSGVGSMSCTSAGNCAATGDYTDSDHHTQGFVVTEQNGVWGTAIEVPGLAALDTGGAADVNSVSCGSASDCVAGGDYQDQAGNGQGFVVTEQNGTWGQAIEVPGLGALNTEGDAAVGSVSCGSAGNCAVGGYYTVLEGTQGFVATEQNGVWDQAIRVPGLKALNVGVEGGVDSVSCASASNCVAVGDYQDGGAASQGFVASEKDGIWRKAFEVPGLDNLNSGAFPGGGIQAISVSCGSPGNCAAAGNYTGTGQNLQGFVATERDGRWRLAIGVPGLRALNTGGFANVNSVSCAPAGGCAAGGLYADRSNTQGFVVSQTG